MRASSRFRFTVPCAIAAAALVATPAADAAVFSCDDSGVQTAAATGGGPHTFSCAGPTTVIVSGVVYLGSVILDGGGDLTLSGGSASQVFWAYGGAAELRDLFVTAGSSFGAPGGCIVVDGGASLLLADVTVSGCTTVSGSAHNIGGAIVNQGTLTLTDSVISGNTGSIGGAIMSGYTAPTAVLEVTRSNISGNAATFAGGGIYVYAGDLAVIDSTISGNQSIGLVIQPLSGTHTITRSTISGNGLHGVHNQAAALVIRDSTVTQNGGVGVNNLSTSPVSIANSTLAGNVGASVAGPTTLLDTIVSGCALGPGPFTSQGGNIESPGNTCGLAHASDQVNVSAPALNLGTLGDHGGPTQTMKLEGPSVAFDSAVSCPPPHRDQRGVRRPQGAGCDSGSFERVVSIPEFVPLLAEGGFAALTAALVACGAFVLADRRRVRRERRA